MRILLWHGYLLGGTGSNVYTRSSPGSGRGRGMTSPSSARTPHPDAHDLGAAEVVRPDVGGLLPVFVLDRYEGYEVKLVQDCTREELERWVEANGRCAPRAASRGSRVLQPRSPRRAGRGRRRCTLRGQGPWLGARVLDARETGARSLGERVARTRHAVFVGSAHIRAVLEDVCGHVDRVHEYRPESTSRSGGRAPKALASLLAEAERDPPNPGSANERLPDENNAERLAAFLEGERPTVVYFGKLLLNKGVHVLCEALEGLDARAVIVGFGDYREELQALADPGTPSSPGRWSTAISSHLLALADACVVPSIFPEAFGMVAAEAAAAGCPPIVARHSGPRRGRRGAGLEDPPELRQLASFTKGDAETSARSSPSPCSRCRPRSARRSPPPQGRAAVGRWSWASVAERLLAIQP